MSINHLVSYQGPVIKTFTYKVTFGDWDGSELPKDNYLIQSAQMEKWIIVYLLVNIML